MKKFVDKLIELVSGIAIAPGVLIMLFVVLIGIHASGTDKFLIKLASEAWPAVTTMTAPLKPKSVLGYKLVSDRPVAQDEGENREAMPTPGTQGYTAPGTAPTPSARGYTAPGEVPRETGVEIPISDETMAKNLVREAQRFWDSGDIDSAWTSVDAALVYDPDNIKALAIISQVEDAEFSLQTLRSTDVADPESVMSAAEAVLALNPAIAEAVLEWDAAAIREQEQCRWQALTQWATNMWADQKQPFPADEAAGRMANVELELINVSGWAGVKNRNDVAEIEVQRPDCCPELDKFTLYCPRWFLTENVEGSPGKGSVFYLKSPGTWYGGCELPAYRAPRKARESSDPTPESTPVPESTPIPTPESTPVAVEVSLEVFPVNEQDKLDTCNPATAHIRGAGATGKVEVYWRASSSGEWKLITTVTPDTNGKWSFQMATNQWGDYVAVGADSNESAIWNHYATCPTL